MTPRIVMTPAELLRAAWEQQPPGERSFLGITTAPRAVMRGRATAFYWRNYLTHAYGWLGVAHTPAELQEVAAALLFEIAQLKRPRARAKGAAA